MSAIQPLIESEAIACAASPLRVLAWPIDPGNPYTASLYEQMGQGVEVEAFSARSLAHRQDIWHVHWPESLLNIRNAALAAFKLSSFLAMIDFVRRRGGRIVWTVHNLKAHDGLHPMLEATFYRRFIPRVDGVISMSETGLNLAGERFPRLRNLPAAVIPHGDYRDQYPRYEGNARAELHIPADARVILFFGEIRAYKNVNALVCAFRNVKVSNALLMIAGRPKTAPLGESLAKEAALDNRVRLALQFIEREQVARRFSAADLVVLPYRHVLNSGAALLALSLNRPVLVPDLGSMGDLRNDFGDKWVRTYSGEIGPETLELALEWAAWRRPFTCAMPDKYRWERIRSQTVCFYKEVLKAR
jgi:glycosyltransferase involved in cell wall biosynthesis